jgi:hypothetical protein
VRIDVSSVIVYGWRTPDSSPADRSIQGSAGPPRITIQLSVSVLASKGWDGGQTRESDISIIQYLDTTLEDR